MKKSLKFVTLIAGTMLFLTGCGADSKKSTTESSSKKATTETTEVATGASESKYTDPKEMKAEYDMIIVGSGGAGMSAAIEAKDKGFNPVIFEKMPVVGGNTNKASSGMNASNTKFQKEQGIEDSNDAFYEETLKGGHGTNDKELLRYFVDHSAESIDWLDSIGIRLNNLTITGGMSQKRTHRPEDGSAVGGYLVKGLTENVQKRNIPIFVNTDVKEIVKSGDAVTGVKVQVQGEKEKEVKGKTVIVTTGGYGAAKDIIGEVRPELKDKVTTNSIGSTGDGIKMIEKVGGYTVDMDQIQVHPTVQQDKGVLIGEAVRGEGAILVNKEGKRFFNELGTRDKVTAAIEALPEKQATLVFDQGVRDRAKAIDFYEKEGYVKKADTLEALAKEIGVPEENLKATMKTWNEAVKNQKDTEFGRTTAMEHDLSKGPFYAITIAPGVHYTMGGVKINANTEVLDKNQKPIPGLYAAGEVTGGLHGQNRIGGNSVAEIIIFGRQAGLQAADYLKK